MKKTLVSAAILATISIPAVHADYEVFGRVQIELTDSDANAGLATTDNRMGRLGVKFKEDLGDGMTGTARIEYGVDTADGKWGSSTDANEPFVSREMSVGVMGAFGNFKAGRLPSAYKGTNTDPFIATTLESRNNQGQSKGTFGHHSFNDNMLEYSNKFGAAAIKLQTNFNGSDGATDGDISASVKYGMGDLGFMVAMSTDAGAAGTTGDEDRTKLAVSYKLGNGKFDVQIESLDNASSGTAGGGVADAGDDVDYTSIQYVHGMGDGLSLVAKYGLVEDQGSEDSDILTLAALKKLSKKMRVWVGYQDTSFDSAATGADNSEFSVGLGMHF